MPGLIGFVKRMVAVAEPATVARTMQETLLHKPYHTTDLLFDDPWICASRVHAGTLRRRPQPCSSGNLHIWLDGEFYNRDHFDSATPSDELLLLKMAKRSELMPFLKRVDGYFAAVIYDAGEKSVTLVTDRFGLRPLYITRSNTGCAWASEIKALCRLPSRSTTLRRDALEQFMSHGYFTGNDTWFGDIELLAPATVLTINCATGESSSQTYWGWDQITPISEPIDIRETSRELGIRFKRAVELRCIASGRIGCGLSGGLDSRAIFAGIPQAYEPITATTFGTRDCADMRIARRVSQLRQSSHLELELTAGNWLDNRAEAVWWADGQMDILDMHGVEQLDLQRERFDVDLNGFLGDALLGGSYASRDNRELERYANRGRRFIALGLVLSNNALLTRMPFFDNDLMELTMSIPLHLRRNSFIYNKMLLETFPEYFRNIPWQKTGLPISRADPVAAVQIFTRKCSSRIASLVPIGLPNNNYADYAAWIRLPPGRRFFSELLGAKKARIFDFVDPKIIQRTLSRHFSGWNHQHQIGRLATVELWLRSLYQ